MIAPLSLKDFAQVYQEIFSSNLIKSVFNKSFHIVHRRDLYSSIILSIFFSKKRLDVKKIALYVETTKYGIVINNIDSERCEALCSLDIWSIAWLGREVQGKVKVYPAACSLMHHAYNPSSWSPHHRLCACIKTGVCM